MCGSSGRHRLTDFVSSSRVTQSLGPKRCFGSLQLGRPHALVPYRNSILCVTDSIEQRCTEKETIGFVPLLLTAAPEAVDAAVSHEQALSLFRLICGLYFAFDNPFVVDHFHAIHFEIDHVHGFVGGVVNGGLCGIHAGHVVGIQDHITSRC